MPKYSLEQMTDRLYGGAGVLAIIIGGTLAAFSAKNPTTAAVWASAYLVLVMGVLQIAFGASLKHLAEKATRTAVDWAWGGFNAGGLLVMYSTMLKYGGYNNEPALYVGSFFIIIAMFSMLHATRRAKHSHLRTGFYILVLVILVSVPTGIVLAGN